jgi:radical SAM enzyme (TIGR01210 family)
MNIQRGTLVEQLWRRGEYRTPWIWSLIEALKKSAQSNPEVSIISHPTGGGRNRGVHNCRKCDSELLQSIRDFSLSQETTILDSVDCDCKSYWSDFLFLE